MGYSACFAIDVNMFLDFYIFFLLLRWQAFVLNKIFNLLYTELVFAFRFIAGSGVKQQRSRAGWRNSSWGAAV